MHRGLLLALALALICVITVTESENVKYHSEDPECDKPCDPQNCPSPGNCLAGLVKDHCDCCHVCGRTEGERCDHPALLNDRIRRRVKRENGICGENLECRIRTDLLATDTPEALCVCTKKEALCGSDGRTYENECQLTAARYERRDGLRAVSRGPCVSAPRIIVAPADVANKTGSYVSLTCEATGWPIPTIEWKVSKGDDIPSPMPSDDPHVAVQTRGGPSNYEITSWLQIIQLAPHDQGTYVCVAHNSEGEAQASATIAVTDALKQYFEEARDDENDL